MENGVMQFKCSILIDREDPFVASIDANGAVIECEARMIVIANAQKYGTKKLTQMSHE
jgi:hypothetical protein